MMGQDGRPAKRLLPVLAFKYSIIPCVCAYPGNRSHILSFFFVYESLHNYVEKTRYLPSVSSIQEWLLAIDGAPEGPPV